MIDSDYRGEIMVALHNHSTQSVAVRDGDRIAQLVLTPYVYGIYDEVQELEETVRGDGGFGSTGY